MSLKFRRTFFYLYIGLFLIMAPLVVLYTAGYRFDFGSGRLVQVGALSITSVPKGVTVALANDVQSQHTPAIIKRVIPGNYPLILSKDGYKNWQRDIIVKSRETTTIENAVLFLDASPSKIHDVSPIVSAASPSGEKVAYGVMSEPWFELWTYDVSSDHFLLLDRLSTSRVIDPQLQWAENGNVLVLSATEKTRRVDHYYAADQSLAGVPSSFAEFSLVKSKTNIALTKTSTTGEVKTLAILPINSYRIVDLFDHYILIKDDLHKAIILIDTTTSGPPILLNVNATFYHWQNGLLIYSDGIELHTYDPSRNDDTLITRSGTALVDATVFPIGQTLLIGTKTSIMATDISDLQHPVNTIIVTAESIQSFWVDRNGRNSYFFGTVNGESGLFKITLGK